MEINDKPLTYKNSWENDHYFVDGKPIKELYAVMIAGKEYTVHSRRVSVGYDDMGHTYTSNSLHFFVKPVVFGIEMEIDLNRIVRKQKVFAIGWEEQ